MTDQSQHSETTEGPADEETEKGDAVATGNGEGEAREHDSAAEASDADVGAAADSDANSEQAEEEPLDPLEKALREASDWRDRAMRTQAELENFRKRMTRERGEAIQYANAGLLESLLPIIDNFEMGLKAARSESEDSVIYQGMNMVFRQTQDFLRDNGIEAVDSVGGVFDPNRHEAVEQQFSDEVEEGHIIAELRRGYRLGDRLLRAANVIVSKGAGNAAAGESEDASAGA